MSGALAGAAVVLLLSARDSSRWFRMLGGRTKTKLLACIFVAVAGSGCLPAADKSRPKPDDVKEFVADPIPFSPSYHFRDFKVTQEDLDAILNNYFQVEEERWKHGYSHVAFGDRTGHVVLKDGRKIKWMVRPGGLARLEFPNGKRIYLAGEKAHSGSPMALEQELRAAMARANKRIQLDPTWAWAPAATDEKRFPIFKQHNESRWNLELDPSKIPAGTMYERTESTEEGGSAGEYLVFGNGQVTWWFDGRRDRFSEFKNPSVRKMKVVRLFVAIHDGEAGWDAMEKEGAMPLDRGLSIGIELQDGSRRYW